MKQEKRIRNSCVLSENGWQKFQNALEEKFDGKCSNERLAELSKLSTDTIANIRRRKKRVDESSIETLFLALGLQLEENDLSVTVQVSPPKLDPNFVGREGAIADLNNLVTQGEKIIVIQGEGGLGKSTLALHFLKTQNFDPVIEFYMAKETQDVSSVEGAIEEWLRRYFNEEPGREFNVTLERLRQQLRNSKQRIGILIDNLEPALDEKGKFIETRRNYVELLRVLADRTVQSVTLITTRECLREAAVEVRDYRLQGLDAVAWREFFNSRNLQTDTPALSAMHQSYGGNAKAMDILTKAIQYDFGGDIEAYWRDNNGDLLIHRDLEDLVVSQFDRLQHLDTNAYRLLCRLGCYRYQDVPTIPMEGLLCLLWDVPEAQRRRVVRSLQERSLVELCDREYKLHPVIRAEALKRLRESEDWETANRKAAEYWTESIETVETIEDALKAFEAYYHYLEINDYELAVTVIVKRRKNQWDEWEEGEPLGTSFYRIGYLQQIISVIARITEKVQPSYSVSRIYNILGTLYEHTGHIHKSIQCNEEAKAIAIDVSAKDIEIVSLLNMGLCKIYIWELEEAVILFKKVIQISENSEYDRYAVYAWFCLAFVNSYFGDKYESEARQFALKVETFMSKTKLQSAWAKGYSLIFLGEAYKNLREYQKSFEKYRVAISYAEKSHYTQVKAKALYGLAELYREQEDFTIALSHHTQSIELLEKIGAKCDLAEAYYQLALTYQKMGDTEKSQPKFQQAIRLFDEMEAPKQVEKVRRAMENGENH